MISDVDIKRALETPIRDVWKWLGYPPPDADGFVRSPIPGEEHRLMRFDDATNTIHYVRPERN